MTAPASDRATSLPDASPETSDTPRTAPVVGRPGARRRVPSLRFLRDVKLPRALRNTLYRRYWLSQFVALAGTWMQNVGSQLVVLSITTSAVAIGALNVAAALPLLIFGLAGGVIADRYDRRKILIAAQGLIALYALGYAALIWTDTAALMEIPASALDAEIAMLTPA